MNKVFLCHILPALNLMPIKNISPPLDFPSFSPHLKKLRPKFFLFSRKFSYRKVKLRKRSAAPRETRAGQGGMLQVSLLFSANLTWFNTFSASTNTARSQATTKFRPNRVNLGGAYSEGTQKIELLFSSKQTFRSQFSAADNMPSRGRVLTGVYLWQSIC